jgi:nucleotidyltransferase/DNA polymerase involved in DNA repair
MTGLFPEKDRHPQKGLWARLFHSISWVLMDTSPSRVPNNANNAKDALKAPSQHIPNFVAQCTHLFGFNRLSFYFNTTSLTLVFFSIIDYETSTFHHLSAWKLQYQRLVSQLNRAKGPEFQPDESFDSSSLSEPVETQIGATMGSSSSHSSCESPAKGIKPRTREANGLDLSFDSSSLPSDDVAAPSHSTSGLVFLHLDMDAFYANVLINRRYPHLKDFPVVVVPAKNTNNGTSEVASANYVARAFGIRARMFVSEARKLCDKLEVLQCDFNLFEDTSARMYEQILRYTHTVEAVSADEAYLDVTPWGWSRALELSRRLQNDVSRATHCPCSIGVGPNKLIARLSTNLAKPAGIIVTEPPQIAEFMKKWKITDLPGVGNGTASKLSERNLHTMEELISVPKLTLQSWLGEKTGNRLFQFARGVDDRSLKTEIDRKSVGTQISWGVRMVNQDQVNAFLTDLSAEVCKRLSEIAMIGSRVTLRILKKKNLEKEESMNERNGVVDARMGGYTQELASMVPKGESAKAFNPGNCIQLSRSGKLAFATGDAKVVSREILRLYKLIGIGPIELRGAGISIDDLEPVSNISKKNATIHSFFQPVAKKAIKDDSSNPNISSAPNDSLPAHNGIKRSYGEIKSPLIHPSPSAMPSIEPSTDKTTPTVVVPSGSSIDLEPPPKKVPLPPPTKASRKQPTITSMFFKMSK